MSDPKMIEGIPNGSNRGVNESLRWPSSGLEFLSRTAFIAAAVYTFNAGLKMFLGAGIWAPAIPLGLLLYTAAAGCLAAAFVVRRPHEQRPQLWIAMVLLVAIVSSVGFEIDFANKVYGTDAIAFAHAGAELLIGGENPYEVSGGSLDEVVDRFNVPAPFVTRSTTGESVDRLISYPSGHVLAYTAAAAIGIEDLRWATLVFEVAALSVIWLALSPLGRLFVPFALLLDSNLPVFFTSGGVTDWLWVLPLVSTALFLHRKRFGYAGLALGLASAMKQQPWFVVPFAAVWVFKQLTKSGEDREVRKEVTSFLVGIGSGFLLLNLPFILWSPGSWLQGVLYPAFADLVPDGQGFSLLASRGVLPIPSQAYALILGFLAIAALWAYGRWFERLQDLLWVIPPTLLLFGHRSFHSYFIYWLPLALLWLDLRLNQQPSDSTYAVDQETPPAGPRPSRSALVLLLALAGGVGYATYTMIEPAPLEVGRVEADLSGGVVTALHVELTNRTEGDLDPVFELYWAGPAVPWQPREHGSIGPNETVIIDIEPKTFDAIPPTRLTAGGRLEVADFRVRVNDSGTSVYTASDLVEIPTFQLAVLNPNFGFWITDPSVGRSPFGWRVSSRGGSPSERQVGPIFNGNGVSLRASSSGSGRVAWIEAAVIQEVGSFSECYEWGFTHTLGYSTTQSGDPLAVSGVQMVQGGRSVWFVPSPVETESVTELPDGTLVIEIPARPGESEQVTLDLGRYADHAGLDVNQGGILKVFSAVHETVFAEIQLQTNRLDSGNCA